MQPIAVDDVYGDMTVVEFGGTYKSTGNKMWKVKCNVCGAERIVMQSDIRKGKAITHGKACKGISKREDIHIGDVYGDMTIISFMGRSKYRNKIFKVRCNICGAEREMVDNNIHNGIGLTHKYSCSRNDYSGLTQRHPRLHQIWKSMSWRVNNPTSNEYHRYGGRGIKIEFEDFRDFVDTMGESYYQHVEKYGERDTTIDRKDNDGNYSASNCRWATMKEQAENRSDRVTVKGISPEGEVYIFDNIKEFGKANGLSPSNISLCLGKKIKQHKGWTFEYYNKYRIVIP